MGWVGWKSLLALILRALLCSANNDNNNDPQWGGMGGGGRGFLGGFMQGLRTGLGNIIMFTEFIYGRKSVDCTRLILMSYFSPI